MTRGRKKDLTIPATRALTQQRDYRARKHQRVTELEERCARAEAECERLRAELNTLKSQQPAINLNPETTHASTDLMLHLGAATASLARFQQLAFAANTTLPAVPPPPPLLPIHLHSSTFHPSPISIASSSSMPPSVGRSDPNYFQRSTTSPSPRERSPSEGSQCCGGFIDCDRVCADEEEHGLNPEREWSRRPPESAVRVSATSAVLESLSSPPHRVTSPFREASPATSSEDVRVAASMDIDAARRYPLDMRVYQDPPQ